MPTKNFYLILGVDPSATATGIRRAFRDLALRYHPDRAGSQGTRFFQDVVEAYDVLSDPERRASYDAGLRHSGAATAPDRRPVPVSSVPAREPLVPGRLSLFHDFYVTQPSVEEVFDRLLRPFTEVPLHGLGIHNLYLRVQLRVGAATGHDI